MAPRTVTKVKWGRPVDWTGGINARAGGADVSARLAEQVAFCADAKWGLVIFWAVDFSLAAKQRLPRPWPAGRNGNPGGVARRGAGGEEEAQTDDTNCG